MENLLKRYKGRKKQVEERSQIYNLIGGVAIGYAITCIIFILYALLLTYTSVTERNLQIIVILTTIISVVIAGFDASRGAKEKGWLWGLAAGALYAVILVFISAIVTKNPSFGLGSFMIIIIALCGGTVGGMLGINSKK